MWLQLSDEHVDLLKRHFEDAVPLTEGEATQLLGRLEQYQSPETNDPEYRALANDLPFISDGECEIDDEAVVSPSEDGAYVMAWVWVDRPECLHEFELDELMINVCTKCGEEGPQE